MNHSYDKEFDPLDDKWEEYCQLIRRHFKASERLTLDACLFL